MSQSGPRFPTPPEPIPSDWQPDERLLNSVRYMLPEEDPEPVLKDFRALCQSQGARRAKWGNTFRTWLQKGRPMDWKLKPETF